MSKTKTQLPETAPSETALAEKPLTRAQQYMKAKRDAQPDIIQPLQIAQNGLTETWFATLLGFGDMSSVGAAMARAGFDLTALAQPGAQRVACAAILQSALVISTTDATKFFENETDALDFYDEPRNGATVAALVGQIIARNPALFTLPAQGVRSAKAVAKIAA